MNRSRRAALVAAVAAATLLMANLAFADDISNNLDTSIDAAAEVMALNVGGANGTTQLYVSPANGDGKNGCNLTGGTTLGLTFSSSNTAAATVSPSSVTFTSCGDTKTLTVTPVAQGSATISATQTSNNTGGTFNLAPATFTVNVAPPTNTAPTVAVASVTGGASYNEGSVPAATCQVTDAEDGPKSFPATLSTITGPYANDGIGSQTASCSYTDAGGLTATASETYSIVDPSAPTIAYTLNPATPDGGAGWYRSAVTLTWSVADTESPSSLVKIGCVDQTVAADQAAVDYTCSATSAGGSAGPVTATIKRDATAPVVTPDSLTDAVWRNTPLSQAFTAEDALSGLFNPADAAFTLTATAESANASTPTTAIRTVTDAAGNSTTRTLSALIDTTDPAITDLGPTSSPNANGWYNAPVSNRFVYADALSGLAAGTPSSPHTVTTTSEGAAMTVQSASIQDVAGNGASAITSAAFPIDTTSPTVSLVGGPANGTTYYAGYNAPQAPTCSASDALSGLDGACSVSGFSSAVGTHTVTAAVTDKAGNPSSTSVTYTVSPLTLRGFFAPVDMGGVRNTTRGGSTVPLKFEVFAGSTEITSTAGISITMTLPYACTGAATTDEIEVTATSASGLRYDTTGGQFIQNWRTPTGNAGKCITVTLNVANSGAAPVTAIFQMK